MAQVRYTNPETFWTVASLRGAQGEVTLVGALPGLSEGMTVRAEGRWEDSPRFGRRFKGERFTELVPATKEGLARYLASGFIQGIGDKLARRLVDAFGDKTIDVILAEPDRLGEVHGLGKKRAQALLEAFRERRGAQDAMVFLLGLDIPRGLALRILKRYGDDTVAAVRRNPYKLAQEVHGIGFIKADQVARGLQIAADHPERIAAGLIHSLREARDEGHVRVRRALLLERATELLGVEAALVEPVLAELAAARKVVIAEHEDAAVSDGVVYLTSLYEAEVGVAWHLVRLAAAPLQEGLADAVAPAAARLGIALAEGQARAVALALRMPLAIVTGGPGTGKTTIIRTLLEAAPAGRVALAAPTGRAAKRMAEATGRPALTIHRLLEFSPDSGGFMRDESDPVQADLVIIDEASMVDLPLMYALVRALADGTRLVLVGDKDQLPPVGPGAPLTDLITSGRVPVARLSEIYRQGKGSAIVEAAHALNHGRPVAPTPPGEALRDFYFVVREEPEQIRAMIEQLVSERIPQRFGLDPIRDIQVLAPMRSGPIGVEVLNERLQALLNPAPAASAELELAAGTAAAGAAALPFRSGDKVMQIRNDYERGVFNGDMGIVRRIERGQLQVEVDERLVVYEREAWDDLVLAYAVTVHKSQGSEYPAVVIPVSTHHFKMLRRNLLYTAVTRGKRLVVLVGTERAMRIAVSNASVEVRDSGLAAALARELRAPAGEAG